MHKVKILNKDFVKENNKEIGTIVKSLWLIVDQPHLYGGIAKMHVYEIKFEDPREARKVLISVNAIADYIDLIKQK